MRISDWCSDVCSSDLFPTDVELDDVPGDRTQVYDLAHVAGCGALVRPRRPIRLQDRKSVVQGKSVSVRVDLGGRRTINKTTNTTYISPHPLHTKKLTHTTPQTG